MKSCIYPPTVRERAERVQESQTVQFHGIRYVYYLQAMHVNVQAHIKKPAIIRKMGTDKHTLRLKLIRSMLNNAWK